MKQKIKQIKLTFLGTGTSTGIPVLACDCEVCCSDDKRNNRLRTSALVEVDGLKYIIDCGPDFRQQMLENQIKDFDAILITHAHHDHVAGIDDIRAYNFLLNKKFDVYSSPETLDSIKLQFQYIFSPGTYKGAPQLNFKTVGNESFHIGENIVLPIQVNHDTLKVLGFRIGGLVYITDAKLISEHEIAKLMYAKVIVINALRRTSHNSHFSLEEALALIERVKPEAAYITHISHQMGLHEEVEQILPENVHLAFDGLVVEINS